MKLSEKATAHILLRANTNSQWDYCEFAIIHFSEDWQKEQAKRFELVKSLQGDHCFQSMNFYDAAVDFYSTDEDGHPDIEELLAGKQWAFVELDNGEEEIFTLPENSLDCHGLVLSANGTAHYTAYGKYTSEEFWTDEFSLHPLTGQQ